MAKDKNPKEARRAKLPGGWKNPIAIVIGLAGVAFLVAALSVMTSDINIPGVDDTAWLEKLDGWNLVIGAVLLWIAFAQAGRTRPPSAMENGQTANRWAAPAMIASAVIGLTWIVVYYVFNGTDTSVPVITDLGAWNIVIGMGFIVAAFGFATKWE